MDDSKAKLIPFSETTSGRSPSWRDANDGYESRVAERLLSVVADQRAVIRELEDVIANRSKQLNLEAENETLRALLARAVAMLDDAYASLGIDKSQIEPLRSGYRPPPTSGSLVTDIMTAAAKVLDDVIDAKEPFTPDEMRSARFEERVWAKLYETRKKK